MGIWERLRGYRRHESLPENVSGRVELEGDAESLSTLTHPVTGEPVIAVEYWVSPPSDLSVNVTGISDRAFTVEATQGVDFVLCLGNQRVLVIVKEASQDVLTVHRHLMDHYGVRLRPRVSVVREGDRVCVRGIAESHVARSAYRDVDYVAVIHADRFWVVEG